VRRPVVGTRVGLQFHDPTDAAAGVVVADQERAEQALCGLGGRCGEDRTIDDAQDG
jgi:hypothetical protein